MLTPVNICCNGFLVYGLLKTKQYIKVHSKLILTLTISDLNLGVFVQPLVVYLFTTENCSLSWLLTFFGYVFFNYSGLTILTVALDRYLRLRRSTTNGFQINTSMVNKIIALLIVTSVTLAVCMTITSYLQVFCYFNICVILVNIMTAGAILTFYTMAWRNVKQQLASIRYLHHKTRLIIGENNHEDSLSSRNTLTPKYDSAMTKTIAAILFCCCLTYPPYFIVGFIRYFTLAVNNRCHAQSKLYILPFFISFFIVFTNSTANSILYSYRNRQIKQLFRSIFCYKKTRQEYLKQSSISSLKKT